MDYLEMARTAQRSLDELAAMKAVPRQTRRLEARLRRRLRDLSRRVEREVLAQLARRATNAAQLAGFVSLIEDDVRDLFRRVLQDAGQTGGNRVVSQLQRAGLTVSFEDVSEQVATVLRDRAFRASDLTLSRLRGNINDALEAGFREGLGIDDVSTRMHDVFDNLRRHEAVRIARTEINTAQNESAQETLRTLGVDFEQWITAQDERVRETHIEMHGQIVRVGEAYSNGLEYPGDRSGPLEEFINCRCRQVPFMMPRGRHAPPGRDWFYEEDLV